MFINLSQVLPHRQGELQRPHGAQVAEGQG